MKQTGIRLRVSGAILLGACLLFLIRFSGKAQTGCTAPSSNNQYWAPGTSISVYIDPSLSAQEQAAAQQAVSDWGGQTALTGNNITLTTTNTDPGANAPNTIRIVNNPAGSPNNLAFTTTNVSSTSPGQMVNATVSLNDGFMLAPNTPAYNPAGTNASTFMDHVFDHELGHVFGENDITPPTDPNTGQPNACLESPGASVMNGYCGTNDTGSGGMPGVGSGITSCDNQVVNNDITTQGGRSTGGGGGGIPLCPKGHQALQDGGCNPSPIIVDVDGSGFQLTDAAHGVLFDIFNNGQPVRVAWTAPGSTNAFLVLDRNNNGTIDNGSELFGNFTSQPQSANPNGFLALAEFDRPDSGGNGDGIIDARDAVYSRLRLWQDSNHDGVAQPEELHTLDEMGVQSISLDYKLSQRTDEFGNEFRFRSKIDGTSQSHGARWAWDVFFVWQMP